MIHRDIENEVLEMSREYPVVTITGPRQSGKTTLAKKTFPEKPYVNLEAPDIRELAQKDPRGLLKLYAEKGAIFDEIQYVPELLSYIQVEVDEQNQKGMFILTGSHQLMLNEAITQSLAGRTALLTLLPLSQSELNASNLQCNIETQILKGFYPRVYADGLDPHKMYRQYLNTYVERDVRQLINLKDLQLFQTFLRLCASRIGQMINASQLGEAVGVSHNTIKNWISILEASYIITRLPPFYSNLKKQLVKSHKLYFIDIGLAAYLLKLETPEQVFQSSMKGALVENWVVIELMKARFNKGLEPNLFFYRDSAQHEVDILFQRGDKLIPIEVKASQTFNAGFTKQIDYIRKLLPDRIEAGYVIYGGEHEQSIGLETLVNIFNCQDVLS